MREKIIQLANVAGFMKFFLDGVMNVLMSKRNFPLKV
jgi:hypothetical protein